MVVQMKGINFGADNSVPGAGAGGCGWGLNIDYECSIKDALEHSGNGVLFVWWRRWICSWSNWESSSFNCNITKCT